MKATPWTPPQPAQPERKLWTNGTDTYIAVTAADVLVLYEEQNGEPYPPDEMGAWEEVERDKRITVGFEQWGDIKETLRDAEQHGLDLKAATIVWRCRADRWDPKVGMDGGSPPQIEAPAAWWAQLPSGFLCSTEW